MGIETVLLTTAIAGSVLSAGAAIAGGQQAKAQAQFEADQAATQAGQAKDAAVAQAEKIRKAARQQQAEATASLAASGVSVGSGTPIRIGQEIYKTAEQDAYQTLLSGQRGLNSGAAQAGMLEASGSNAATTGFINAGSSLLSGASAALRSGWKTPATTTPTGTGSIK